MIIKSQKPDSKIQIVKEPSAIPGMYKNGINRRSIYKTGLPFHVVEKINSFPADRSRNRTPLGVVSISLRLSTRPRDAYGLPASQRQC